MTGYIGIGGKAKKVNSLYVGIGGKAKKVIKGYVGVGGKAKLWYSAQKLWTWEKHNINTTTVYVEVVGSTSSTTRSSAFYVGSTYSFNSSTGQFTVNQTTQIANSSTGATNAKDKYYITLTNTSGSQTGSTVYKITNATYSSSYRRLTLTLQAIGSESQTQQSMGSLVGTVTNVDVTTYPANGPQDGYWYVLTGIPSFTYSGSYNSGVVEMGDQYYLLLELTGSGSLALGKTEMADVWICGGGSVGGSPKNGFGYAEGYGGGAGAYATSTIGVNIKDLVVSIGVGGTQNSAATATNITGDISLSVNNIPSSDSNHPNWNANCRGGTGGGLVYETLFTNYTGDGLSKLPFNSTYFPYPFCDGGGGGGYRGKTSPYRYAGGAGGTNGGNGSSYSYSSSAAGGAGGGHYGGAGGNPISIGQNATGYGSGGGGGGSDYDEGDYDGGNGYQGVCFIRIPLQ